jgi:hypothetical protein
MLRYTLNIEASNGCIINRESRNTTGLVVCLWLIVPRSCWGTHQSQSLQHAAMDAPSTENQGIQPDPLYACGWSFQDRVEVHTKAKQAFSTLPWWIHYQQRIREFNRTRCTRVVGSKIVLRSTPKPNKPSACCHGCTINRESRNTTGPVVRMWLIVPRSCWGTHQSQTSLRQAAMDAPDVWKRGNEISLKQQIVS